MAREISIINALRAFAALWVMTAHCVIWSDTRNGVAFPPPKIAVDIFIVLSGFLMSYTVAMRDVYEPISSAAGWIGFYIRRFCRIAPAYYLSLAFAVILSPYFLGGYNVLRALNSNEWQGDFVYNPSRIEYGFKNILLHITFLFGFYPTYSFSTFLPDWSIGLEMQFYAVFPLIFLLMRRFGPARVALLLVIISYLIVAVITYEANKGSISRFYEPSLLFYRLPIFLSGMLIYETTRSEAKKFKKYTYAILSILFCTDMYSFYGIDVLWLVVPVAILIAMIMPHQPIYRRIHWLNFISKSKCIIFMSTVSYSVYLFHGFFLAILGSKIGHFTREHGLSPGLGTFLIILVVLPLTYVFAFAAYRLVELPGIRLSRYIVDRLHK